MDRLLPSSAPALPPYAPSPYQRDDAALASHPGAIRLSLSENAHGCSPAAVAAAARELGRLERYPDAGCGELREAIADRLGVADDHVLVGNGIDELLALVAQALLGPGGVGACSAQTYFGHRAAIMAAGAQAREAPLGAHGLDVDPLVAATKVADVLVVSNPHNPTGTALDAAALDALAAASADAGCVLVLDEAYAEFAAPDRWGTGCGLVERGDVIVLRTFSKAHGLAGLRCGFALARPDLLERIAARRHVTPFSVNRVALAAARAALADEAFLERSVEQTRATLSFLADGLRRGGHHVHDSQASFLLATTPEPAAAVADRLLEEHDVHARPCAPLGLPHGLRLGACRPAEEERVLAALLHAMDDGRALADA